MYSSVYQATISLFTNILGDVGASSLWIPIMQQKLTSVWSHKPISCKLRINLEILIPSVIHWPSSIAGMKYKYSLQLLMETFECKKCLNSKTGPEVNGNYFSFIIYLFYLSILFIYFVILIQSCLDYQSLKSTQW